MIPEALHFHDTFVVQNVIRVIVIVVGFTLAMLAIRFAWVAWRTDERFRVAGILSFACIVATPSIGACFRFDAPINWWSYGTYFTGLALGFTALWANYTIAPTWWRLGRRRTEAEGGQHVRTPGE